MTKVKSLAKDYADRVFGHSNAALKGMAEEIFTVGYEQGIKTAVELLKSDRGIAYELEVQRRFGHALIIDFANWLEIRGKE